MQRELFGIAEQRDELGDSSLGSVTSFFDLTEYRSLLVKKWA